VTVRSEHLRTRSIAVRLDMARFLPGFILAGYGIFIMSLLARNVMTWYINPNYVLPTTIAGAVLIGLAAVRLGTRSVDAGASFTDMTNDRNNLGIHPDQHALAFAPCGALLIGNDGGESHIVFVVRNDRSRSDIYYQTSDTTWQAYNDYGGNRLYTGGPLTGGNQPPAAVPADGARRALANAARAAAISRSISRTRPRSRSPTGWSPTPPRHPRPSASGREYSRDPPARNGNSNALPRLERVSS